MSLYRIQLMKQSWAALGGEAGEEHEYAEPINPQTEAIESGGIYLQDATHRDASVLMARGPSGEFWFSNPGTIIARNAANSGNIQILGLDGTDNILLGSSSNPSGTTIKSQHSISFLTGTLIDLPNGSSARFTIAGSAVTATVTATALNTVTGGPAVDANAYHTHTSMVSVVPAGPCFRADGYYRVATGIDILEPMASFGIVSIIMRREIAGTSGTTEIDILKNGSTIFTTTANRPKVLYSAGNAARVTAVPDITAVTAGDRLELVILSAEGGNPQDLVAFIQVA